jgi:TPP-dependent pyruvate/acetoin dehydrogenase alpha subunit
MRFEKKLLADGTAAQADIDAIQKRVRDEVDKATDEAERSPMPDPAHAALGLFAGDGYWNG